MSHDSHRAEFGGFRYQTSPPEHLVPRYLISLAAELADMHPQTLRQYDRMGLVVPQRQGGRQRRYSLWDVHQLRRIQQLSRDGVSLEGIRRIVELEKQVEVLQETVAGLLEQVQHLHSHSQIPRTFTAGATGDVTTSFGTPQHERAEADTASSHHSEEELREARVLARRRRRALAMRALTTGPGPSHMVMWRRQLDA